MTNGIPYNLLAGPARSRTVAPPEEGIAGGILIESVRQFYLSGGQPVLTGSRCGSGVDSLESVCRPNKQRFRKIRENRSFAKQGARIVKAEKRFFSDRNFHRDLRLSETCPGNLAYNIGPRS
jgi:hypothetical protein